MNHHIFTSNQQPVYLANEPLGRGGEGNVYQVYTEKYQEPLVAKIYHEQELQKEHNHKLNVQNREAKVKHLVTYQSFLAADTPILFPEELLYNEQGAFVGFLMRQASGQIDLSALSTLSISVNLSPIWHERYDRAHLLGVVRRAQLCQKIASVFAQMHQTGSFVMVDVKPENIRIALNGEVALIDIDSIQIVKDQQVLFPAEKLTPEYCPPEYQQLDFKKDLIPQSWDQFALGVIFYKVMLGLHPYTGSCRPPYDRLTTNAQKIAQGLFPNGLNKAYFSTIPYPHKGFEAMPVNLQNLFSRCFEAGHLQPEVRPKAEEWVQAFDEIPEESYLDLITDIPQLNYPINNHASHPQVATYTQAMAGQQALTPVKESRMALLGFLGVSFLILTYLGALFRNIAGDVPATTADYGYHKQYVPGEYQWASTIAEGRRLVLNYQKYGYLNSAGEVVIPLQFDNAGDFKEGFAWVEKNGKYGYINHEGKIVIPLRYAGAGFFFSGVAQVIKKTLEGKKYFLIDRDGKQVTQMYDYLGDFYYGRARVRRGKLMGFIDLDGQEVIPLKYLEAENFDETGTVLVGDQQKKYYIDKAGNYIKDHINTAVEEHLR